eukprot:m.640706 g.640706  ORF g.640706 m.640706 type:complete len:57 (+) comp22622_c1_seq1:139-309(+)
MALVRTGDVAGGHMQGGGTPRARGQASHRLAHKSKDIGAAHPMHVEHAHTEPDQTN